MKTFPQASGLPTGMIDLIVRLADLWAQEPGRPRPATHVYQHWESLVADWAGDISLPLYVRKFHNNRGSLVIHASGRHVVPTDNSPAQWAFAKAVLGETPSLQDIRQASSEDRIPIAMVLKVKEREMARYKCTLDKVVNPNSAGWKLAHVDGVGLGRRTLLTTIDESILRQHFRKLMGPANMFVIPLKYAGLGELAEFCRAVGALTEPF